MSPTTISTGVEALDARVGTLQKGRCYLFVGPSGAGKSTVALHFLQAGLERGEKCLLVTEGNRRALDGQARFVGIGPGRFTEHENLRILDLSRTERLGWAGATQALGLELQKQPADRLVIDSLHPFVRDAATPQKGVEALTQLLERTSATKYVLSSRTGNASPDPTGPLRRSCAAVFEIRMSADGERELRLSQVDQPIFRSDPLRFFIIQDAGVSEHLTAAGEMAGDAEVLRSVVVVDDSGMARTELLQALEESYELRMVGRSGTAFPQLVGSRFGALIVTLDPYDADRAFDLTFALRKAGHQAPILYLAPSRGLRSTTRARGLRIGGDDFLVAELSTTEILERLRRALLRGHRRSGGSIKADDRIIQPVNDVGEPRNMDREELRAAMQALNLQASRPTFALYLLKVPAAEDERFWPVVRESVRILDGDLVGRLDEEHLGVVLLQVDRSLSDRLETRFRGLHPMLEPEEAVRVILHPDPGNAVAAWLRNGDAGSLPAHPLASR